MGVELTQSDVEAARTELCKRSLAYFAQQCWHVLEPATPLKWGWALDAICAHLEAVESGDVKRLLMNVPPGTMKSLLTSVIFPAWLWGPRAKPQKRILATAHKMDLAIRDNLKCRRLIQSDWYQTRWPVKLAGDQNAKTKFENTNTGIRECSAFATITGVRGDIVILDDPNVVNGGDADLLAAELSFTEALPTRVNNEDSAIIVIMQRVHEKDVSGIILGRKLPYVHLCIPMRFEQEKPHNAIGWQDPRTEVGELMFPERFSESQVSELETVLGPVAAPGQLQQRPVSRGGGMLKSAWMNYYIVPPALEYRFMTADTAQKTGQHNDYSVVQLWARSTIGQAVLLDQLRGKWETPDLLPQVRAFWLKHLADRSSGTVLRGIYVEDKSSGTGLVQTLRREGIVILPVQRNRDKVVRASDAAPFMASGNVLLPETAPWLSDLLGEIEQFPSGAHDDQLDPMFDAIQLVQMTPRQQAEWQEFQQVQQGRRYAR